MYMSFRIHFTK